MYDPKTRAYLQRAGFRSIETYQLAHDIQNNWYVVRKQDQEPSQKDNPDDQDRYGLQ